MLYCCNQNCFSVRVCTFICVCLAWTLVWIGYFYFQCDLFVRLYTVFCRTLYGSAIVAFLLTIFRRLRKTKIKHTFKIECYILLRIVIVCPVQREEYWRQETRKKVTYLRSLTEDHVIWQLLHTTQSSCLTDKLWN